MRRRRRERHWQRVQPVQVRHHCNRRILWIEPDDDLLPFHPPKPIAVTEFASAVLQEDARLCHLFNDLVIPQEMFDFVRDKDEPVRKEFLVRLLGGEVEAPASGWFRVVFPAADGPIEFNDQVLQMFHNLASV